MTKRSSKKQKKRSAKASQPHKTTAAAPKSSSASPIITPAPDPDTRSTPDSIDTSAQNKSPAEQGLPVNSEPTPAPAPDAVVPSPVDPQVSHYDPHIMPAETVARQRREGTHFGHVEHDPKETSHIHNRDGYTMDQEGLINNYAIEPKMYISEPGDLDEQEAAIARQKAADRRAMTRDDAGKLTPKNNWNHRGPGII